MLPTYSLSSSYARYAFINKNFGNGIAKQQKMAAAVVRVKRHLDEDPLNALILNCKRRKLDKQGPNLPDKVAVLQFAGTLEEENIENLLKKHNVATAEELKEQFKKPPTDLLVKLRTQVKENSKNSRYKVVNCFRQTVTNEQQKTSENCEPAKTTSELRVFDIETDCNKNDSETEDLNKSEKKKYVYDFYYTCSDDLGDADLEQFSVCPLVSDPLVYGSVRDNGLDDQDSEDDSEDSNAENYWTHDYPDEEEDIDSINEDDMIEAVNNLKMEDDLLSSDEGEENIIYSDNDDFKQENQDIYSKMYSKFKAKHDQQEVKGLNDDLYCGDIDEEEYFY